MLIDLNEVYENMSLNQSPNAITWQQKKGKSKHTINEVDRKKLDWMIKEHIKKDQKEEAK